MKNAEDWKNVVHSYQSPEMKNAHGDPTLIHLQQVVVLSTQDLLHLIDCLIQLKDISGNKVLMCFSYQDLSEICQVDNFLNYPSSKTLFDY